MDPSTTNSSYLRILLNNTKAQTLDSMLQKSLDCFRDFLSDFQELYIESENYKSKFVTQQELCQRCNCGSAESLKNVIKSKNKIILSIASILTRFNETKNFNLIDEVFRIICRDSTSNEEDVKIDATIELQKTDNECLAENISLKEQSLNEIEGTPTGCTSPIIHLRKHKNISKVKTMTADNREKVKCPDSWVTPEKKTMKLLYPTPSHSKHGGRLRQSRLNLVKLKQTDIVDLTCSSQLSGEVSSIRSECTNKQLKIKTEPIDSDIILSSPTNESLTFTFKPNTINSPVKVIKNSLSLKNTKENVTKVDSFGNTRHKPKLNLTDIDNSINILNPFHKRHPIKIEDIIKVESIESDDYESNSSMSLLEELAKQEKDMQMSLTSSIQQPLAENINVTNTPPKKKEELWENYASKSKINIPNVNRCIPEFNEPLYKEPAARRKSEKRALPGWCCEECEHFFGELYRDNPDMMAKKIEECSKHRGRQNPNRPKTPPNFWNPRWSVPENTEELNRMNNAI